MQFAASLFRCPVQASSTAMAILGCAAAGRPGVYANAAFQELPGFTAEDIERGSLALLHGQHTDPGDVARLQAAVAENREQRLLIRSHRKDGSGFWNLLHVIPLHDAGAGHCLLMLRDVTEQRGNVERLVRHAHRDPLTGLVLLLPLTPAGIDAASVRRRVSDALERPVTIGGYRFQLACSIGISVYPTGGCDRPSLFRSARPEGLGKAARAPRLIEGKLPQIHGSPRSRPDTTSCGIRRTLAPIPAIAGAPMSHDDLIALLARARTVLERHLLEPDGEAIRDDVAEICMAIDDALPDQERVQIRKIDLERSAA